MEKAISNVSESVATSGEISLPILIPTAIIFVLTVFGLWGNGCIVVATLRNKYIYSCLNSKKTLSQKFTNRMQLANLLYFDSRFHPSSWACNNFLFCPHRAKYCEIALLLLLAIHPGILHESWCVLHFNGGPGSFIDYYLADKV